MFSILLVLLIFAIPHRTFALEREDRVCECTREVYYCDNPGNILKYVNPPGSPYPAADTNSKCDFRCANKCEKEIRKELSNNLESYDTDMANSKVCDEVTPNASENRRRICVASVAYLSGCGSIKRKVIEGILCSLFFYSFIYLLLLDYWFYFFYNRDYHIYSPGNRI